MRTATTAAAALMIGFALAAPAQATAEPPHAHPRSAQGLFLSASDAAASWVKGATLNCASAPPDGSHPHTKAACADLAAAGGRFDGLLGERRMCHKKYDPVTVSASGTYLGNPVSWRKTYPNVCVLESKTGSVFRF
ncbi:SSI family serine proteinase inhibitor [Streptomyces tsukubensis]|uniref:Subtilisin inhibitor domain-containing protein n=1 Tax=Streptomyces tsukubensis TaxID=83656 RepID=A0A1V4A6C1_9ACTN|nr:SSI family serine proteinase inhibitor [Streptomyces tsukubensis]OON77308.1 hypothetical protein B1H18_18860 [Streptomyces tsukubensis]QFR92383.1 protease inhibitor SIL-V5 [Streptomyces tsukubensis]